MIQVAYRIELVGSKIKFFPHQGREMHQEAMSLVHRGPWKASPYKMPRSWYEMWDAFIAKHPKCGLEIQWPPRTLYEIEEAT